MIHDVFSSGRAKVPFSASPPGEESRGGGGDASINTFTGDANQRHSGEALETGSSFASIPDVSVSRGGPNGCSTLLSGFKQNTQVLFRIGSARGTPTE